MMPLKIRLLNFVRNKVAVHDGTAAFTMVESLYSDSKAVFSIA